jgi:hypothetical protein
MALMSKHLMIPVASQNKDIVMLGGFSRYATMVFVARPDIKVPTKGKTRHQRPGDPYESAPLKHLGLDADKDIKMLALGSNDIMWARSNRPGMTILSPPGTISRAKRG